MNKFRNIPELSPRDIIRLSKKIVTKKRGNSCWIWSDSLGTGGYGLFSINKGNTTYMYKAHRVVYSVFVKPVATDMVIDHICKNRLCVNPDHLREVTFSENVLNNSDGIAAKNKIKSHCKRGHKFTEDNTYITTKKGRSCKACINLRRGSNADK